MGCDENSSSASQVRDGNTDGYTERHNEARVCFRNICERPLNQSRIKYCRV
jgi:hypothetical protein